MNALFRAVVLSSAAAGLAACATTPPLASQATGSAAESRQVRVVNDDAYIAYVERVARRRGVIVQWVNPPTRRIVAERQ